MRTLLIVMVLAASAQAEPSVQAARPHASPLAIDVTELTVTGAGGVQTMVIHDALSQLDDTTLRCYTTAQLQAPRLAGTITLKFRVDARGAASNIAVTGVPSVSKCLSAAIKAATFAGPAKGPIEIREKITLRILVPQAGILGVISPTEGGAFASLTGSGDLSSGFDDANVYGGLLGSEAGTGGMGGLGVKAKAPSVTVATGQLSTQGDLDQAIIRRYIRRNLQKLRYCYEKQLLAAPGLAGTVLAKFTIDAHGKVIESTASGMSDVEVNTCVASVIRDIEFPKPKAGEVSVSYPFTFRPG